MKTKINRKNSTENTTLNKDEDLDIVHFFI